MYDTSWTMYHIFLNVSHTSQLEYPLVAVSVKYNDPLVDSFDPGPHTRLHVWHRKALFFTSGVSDGFDFDVFIFRINTIMDSDRVLVMHAGKVAEFDTPSALCQNDQSIFHRLVGGGGGEWAKTQRGLTKVELETWCFLYLTTEMSCWFSLNDTFCFINEHGITLTTKADFFSNIHLCPNRVFLFMEFGNWGLGLLLVLLNLFLMFWHWWMVSW